MLFRSENNLGLKGKVAYTYAKLLKVLWYESLLYTSPHEFKKTISKQHATFGGYEQQDSQELISAILDSLHEDLNRVKTKPYVKKDTIVNINDDSKRETSWYNYLARNMSIIVDIFYGQYKSILQCPICKKYSITFDPFSIISLPIPQNDKISLELYYVPYDIRKNISKVIVTLTKFDKINKIREELVNKLNVNKYGSIITMIYGNLMVKYLGRHIVLSELQSLKNYNIYVQEINPEYFSKATDIELNIEEDKSPNDNKIIDMNNSYNKSNDVYSESLDKEDYNNGLNYEYIKIVISIVNSEKNKYEKIYKIRNTFDRVLYFKKSDTLKQVHLTIFRYFRPLFEEKLLDYEDEEFKKEKVDWKKINDEKFYMKLFPNLSAVKCGVSRAPPYILNFVNTNRRDFFGKPCPYCLKTNCDNCLVPFIDSWKISDMLAKLGIKNHNSYFYRTEIRDDFKPELKFEVFLNKEDKIRKIDIERLTPPSVLINPEEEIVTGTTIYDCLDAFNMWERLDTHNLWNCYSCKKEVQAIKKMEITRTPPILILHLKRFKSELGESQIRYGQKLNRVVDFPLVNFDLRKYTKTADIAPIYDLYAVSNHYGSIGFGHYTAVAWNKEKKAWYEFDDSKVNKINADKICTSASYVLFYRRRDISETIDYKRIKQVIPKWYKVPIYEIDKKTEKPKNNIKPNNGYKNDLGSKNID